MVHFFMNLVRMVERADFTGSEPSLSIVCCAGPEPITRSRNSSAMAPPPTHALWPLCGSCHWNTHVIMRRGNHRRATTSLTVRVTSSRPTVPINIVLLYVSLCWTPLHTAQPMPCWLMRAARRRAVPGVCGLRWRTMLIIALCWTRGQIPNYSYAACTSCTGA